MLKLSAIFPFFSFILSLTQRSLLKWNDRICTTKIVHIIWTAISDIDVCCPVTAVITVVKTHPPADLTVCYCGVTTLQPACNISVTPLDRWTWSWHPCAGWPFKTKPSSAFIVITITVPSISYLPVSIVQSRVILTFWHKKTIVKMIKTWKAGKRWITLRLKCSTMLVPSGGERRETAAFAGWREKEGLLCRLFARSLSFVSLATRNGELRNHICQAPDTQATAVLNW